MLNFDDVARLAAELSDVTEGVRHGNRAWSIADVVFAWERPLRKADLQRLGDQAPPEGPILAVRVADLSAKAGILEAGHAGFFTIAHFDGYAAVLIELRLARRQDVRDTLAHGWMACSSAKPARRRTTSRPRG